MANARVLSWNQTFHSYMSVGVAECGGCGLWGLRLVGYAACGVCRAWGFLNAEDAECGELQNLWVAMCGSNEVCELRVVCSVCGLCVVCEACNLGVAVCGSCGVWRLLCVRVAVLILRFFFCIFANLTLEFCYQQTSDPGTLQMVLKAAYLCGQLPL